MKAGLASMVYAVDVGGKPTVAFKSESWANARLVSQELWFRIEVGSVTSNDKPVWDCEAELVVRPATAAEIEQCWRETEAADRPSNALTYLVEIDPF